MENFSKTKQTLGAIVLALGIGLGGCTIKTGAGDYSCERGWVTYNITATNGNKEIQFKEISSNNYYIFESNEIPLEEIPYAVTQCNNAFKKLDAESKE